MAVNDFNKEERVMFEDIFEGFEDQLVASQNVNTFGTNGTLMERTNDTIWRPQQVISVGGDRIIGSDITIKGKTKLSVPAVLDKQPHDNFQLTALELRDALADGTLGIASRNYIASRVNSDVLDTACNQATIVVPISTAAGDYDDIALCESVMNEMGVSEPPTFEEAGETIRKAGLELPPVSAVTNQLADAAVQLVDNGFFFLARGCIFQMWRTMGNDELGSLNRSLG